MSYDMKKQRLTQERLRKERERKGWSQEQLAQTLEDSGTKISLQSIKNYERNVSNISSSNLCILADIFNVSVDYLLGRTNMRTPKMETRAISEYIGLSEDAISNLISDPLIDEDGDSHYSIASTQLSRLLEDEKFCEILGDISALYMSAENKKYFEMKDKKYYEMYEEDELDSVLKNDPTMEYPRYNNFIGYLYGRSISLDPSDFYNFFCHEIEKEFISMIESHIEKHLESIDVKKEILIRINSYEKQQEDMKKEIDMKDLM